MNVSVAQKVNKAAVRIAQNKQSAMERKRSVAKAGMTLSLGALIVTGLMQGRGARTLHIWSGVSLVGFSIWHHRLYQPAPRGNKG
ncbi:MAG: hypothetical protein PVG49_08075 [Desulfobacteraceae bacterium]|jgi:hypothetical protein